MINSSEESRLLPACTQNDVRTEWGILCDGTLKSTTLSSLPGHSSRFPSLSSRHTRAVVLGTASMAKADIRQAILHTSAFSQINSLYLGN